MLFPTAVGAKEIASVCILHPLSRPSSCGEVSAHGAVTSSSLVPGLRPLSRVRSSTRGVLSRHGE